jgi:DNA polymerase-3 subunit epsilon
VEVDKLQVLIKPKREVPSEIIAIHNITNQILRSCLDSSHHAAKVAEFFKGDFYVAHHAPFDLGFMAYFFEKENKPLPCGFGVCTSLLARKIITDVENHKLQTLARRFQIETGSAHRALDDAKTCAELFKIIINQKLKLDEDISKLQKIQGYNLSWERFSLKKMNFKWFKFVESAIEEQQDLEVIYKKGTSKGMKRKIKPLGVVRSPLDGDYIPAWCYSDNKRKRFMMDHFQEILPVE